MQSARGCKFFSQDIWICLYYLIPIYQGYQDPSDIHQKTGVNCVNLLWLTASGAAGVILIIHWSGRFAGGDSLESITFNVDELSRLDTMEQARRLEEAERQIDDVQRAAAGDPTSLDWVNQQRQYLVEMQHLIFEC